MRLPYYLYSGWQVSGWWLCSNLPIYSLMWLSWALHHRHLLFGYALGGLHSCSAEIRSLHLRFVPLLYHKSFDLSRPFLKFFCKWWGSNPHYPRCQPNRRHLPQRGDPDSNGRSDFLGDSPQPMHTLCVLYPYYIIL